MSSGALGLLDKVQGQEFRAFLSSVGEEPRAWICCRDGVPRQMVRAEAVRPDNVPAAVALMIYPIDGSGRFLWSDFDKVFGLTRAETIVVKRIMGGESADTIAGELSVALDTIRTHVRRVYAKLGVSNREQLFSKMSVFRLLQPPIPPNGAAAAARTRADAPPRALATSGDYRIF